MGRYINVTSDGTPLDRHGKVARLVADGATVLPSAPTMFAPDLVCVIDNGPFEAAGYCFDEDEFSQWMRDDSSRRRVWLTYPHAETVAR